MNKKEIKNRFVQLSTIVNVQMQKKLNYSLNYTSLIAIDLSCEFNSVMLISFNTTRELSSFFLYKTAVPKLPE